MPRISGVDIPDNKRIEAALTYIYGIGASNVRQILQKAKIDPNKRTKDLDGKEVALLQKIIEQVPTEGVLRKIVSENIKRLRHINSYRGLRHSQKLPARGQRTRSNARTKRGKRMTVGAMRKELAHKMAAAKKEKD